MAAGAGMCGVCYWQVPACISGHSDTRMGILRGRAAMPKWTPDCASALDRHVPLKNFDGNYCTSAMTSFQTVGYLRRIAQASAADADSDPKPLRAKINRRPSGLRNRDG